MMQVVQLALKKNNFSAPFCFILLVTQLRQLEQGTEYT